jgi:hypothetical protein
VFAYQHGTHQLSFCPGAFEVPSTQHDQSDDATISQLAAGSFPRKVWELTVWFLEDVEEGFLIAIFSL